MDVLQEIQELKQRASELERQRAKREADLDAAEARLRENVETLRSEFGVSSVAEAEEMLRQLEQELKRQVLETKETLGL